MPRPWVAFRSERLPIKHFNERFSDENLAFWAPLFVKVGRISAGQRVLDVGCGTGGYARAIAAGSSAVVVGVDCSRSFLAFAACLPGPRNGEAEWLAGDAEQLPVKEASFDRVVLSLILHQLAHPFAAVAEAFRVLVDGGLLLIRTIAPEDASGRVPGRYLPSMAQADAERMPPIETIEGWLEQARFVLAGKQSVPRNQRLVLADEERRLLAEARHRYSFIDPSEIERGLRAMQADAEIHGSNWIDPRPTWFLTGLKPR